MHSFIKLYKEQAAYLYLIAAIFFVLGYLFSLISTPANNFSIKDLRLSMHLVGGKFEVFDKAGERIGRRASSQHVELPGRFYDRHHIDVLINKVNPYYYYMTIDGVNYCFLLDDNWQVIGSC